MDLVKNQQLTATGSMDLTIEQSESEYIFIVNRNFVEGENYGWFSIGFPENENLPGKETFQE